MGILQEAEGIQTKTTTGQEKKKLFYSILRDILVLFGDLTTGIPHKMSSKPREETKNS